ncbi:hypothetical protein F3Y22_tig00110895pilonHSYRG00256 [Hibiscus syriacus]|uniref:Uncharacterized protein n=1 Tax=Hibiscus syriacus TaxID=106335 RepID=A0A6A2ZFF7_HIBSY|nr:hypothetical protein F3Y22_tig00110895pilonHSYRG00256 [Hibiscus syriacus]
MREYLMKIKNICDNLASYGEVISEHEYITDVLNGLPLEYDSVITVIAASANVSDLITVTTILLDAEARPGSIVESVTIVSHIVSIDFLTIVVEGRVGARLGLDSRGYSTNQANMCTYNAHGSIYSHSCNSTHPCAIVVYTFVPAHAHHLVPQSVYTHVPYSVTSVPISPYSFAAQANENAWHLNQFTQDNKVSLEFFPSTCVVRDLNTRKVILHGSESNGLYKLGSFKNKSIDVGSSTLGHPSLDVLTKALSQCNMPIASNKMEMIYGDTGCC